jgi:hypothetical protein
METKTKRTRKTVTREIMRNRIHKVQILRANYSELAEMIDDDSLKPNVKRVLLASAQELFINLQKAERKVIVSVQKKLAEDFSAAEILFDTFSDRWISDPSVTIVENDDSEDDDSDENEVSQDSLTA